MGEFTDVDGHTMTVIGIAAPGFQGVHARHEADIWLPGVMEYIVRNQLTMRTDDRAAGGYYEFAARLAAGATWADARKELHAVTTWLAEKYPAGNQKFWEVGFHEYGPIGCASTDAASARFQTLRQDFTVVAFAVASRRADLGIRIALGASASAVRRHVLRGTVIVATFGLLFGLAGAFGLVQVLRARLVGVSPLDPTIWTTAAVLLVAIVVLASLLPARHAARVNPADTLRVL